MKRRIKGVLSVLAFAGWASGASALPILTPSDLNPGDTYQLVFVTSTLRDATSNNIKDYNAFVQSAADAAWLGGGTILDGVKWSAIGSTATVDARDNAAVSGPVYNLGDERVASGKADMWDGVLGAAIDVDETGLEGIRWVWTGTDGFGYGKDGVELGGGFSQVSTVGTTITSGTAWIDNTQIRVFFSRSLYALSDELVVPGGGQAPAPATLALFGLGLAGLGITRRKRQAKR